MKTIFKNIIATSLAFLVLFTTLSFTVNEHYCGDILIDSTLFTKAKTCGMEMQKPIPNSTCSIKKKDCCKDVVKLVKGQENLKIDFANLDSYQQQVFITSFVYSYVALFESLKENTTLYKYYTPPLVIKSIYKLDESFLI